MGKDAKKICLQGFFVALLFVVEFSLSTLAGSLYKPDLKCVVDENGLS